MKTIKLYLLVLLPALLLTIQSAAQNNSFEISKNLDIYATLLKELDKNYTDEINPADLTETAINAMLNTLDPYTVFIPESRTEDYKMLTTGQYGGIGALIHKKGEFVYISEPYKDFPADKAGLKAGDRIIEINGQSTEGKSSSEVSEILKGQPGVEMELMIERYGEAKPLKIDIVRENIRIPNVPYFGMVDDHLAYIKLANFTPKAGNEVKKAFLKLKEENEVKGVVIDLRGNGGGLLNEAVSLVNIFVEKGTLVVSTKGKMVSRNTDHYTRFSPADTEIPVVVLVDGGSASASEIVAGSMQDLDRGVVIGEQTFGKGLVQNVIPLTYNTQMKVTVAKYYIPSGRCIQAIDYFHKDENGDSHKVPDSLIREFKTKNGRIVLDGKGIEPDINVEPAGFSNIAEALITKFLIFDYATKYAHDNETIQDPHDFFVDDATFNDFMNFIEDKDYTYKTRSEEALEKLKKIAERENYFDAIEEEYDHLLERMINDKKQDLITYKEEIKQLLSEEIASRYYYQEGRVIVSLEQDPELEKAKEVLRGMDTYFAILDGTYDK